jgi:hypothetical protein
VSTPAPFVRRYAPCPVDSCAEWVRVEGLAAAVYECPCRFRALRLEWWGGGDLAPLAVLTVVPWQEGGAARAPPPGFP